MALLRSGNPVSVVLSLLNVRSACVNGANTMVLKVICRCLPFVILPVCAIVDGVSGNLVRTTRSLNSGGFAMFEGIITPLDIPKVVSNIAVMFIPDTDAFLITRCLNNPSSVVVNSIVRGVF